MASRSRVLYTGVTNDLVRRVEEHKRGLTAGFTSRYRVSRLVYFEPFGDVRDAIARETQLKGWGGSFAPAALRMTGAPASLLLLSFSAQSAPCHPERARGTRASEGSASANARNARAAKDPLPSRSAGSAPRAACCMSPSAAGV